MDNKMYITPEQEQRRWQILGRENPPEKYDVVDVTDIGEEAIRTLVEEGFLEREDFHNCSPYVEDYMDFMSNYPGKFKLGGYVVCPTRDDVRITFDSIESCGEVDLDMMIDFTEKFRCADSFTMTRNCLFAWWD